MHTNLEQADFFENRNGARLFSIVHRPPKSTQPDLGVVFCHPISWEKQFSYRVYTEFSRYLAAGGYASLRFDSFGFGDSDGDLEDATIRSQVEDVLDAIERLHETAGCTRFVLFGVRLGAAIAALAAAESPRVEGLVMVSPVVHGDTYWKDLLRFSRFGRMTLGQKPISSKTINARLESEGLAEIDGELFSRAYVEELRQIDLTRQCAEFKGSYLLRELVTGGPDKDEFTTFVDTLKQKGVQVSASFEEPKEFWIMKSRYEGYLPHSLFNTALAWLGEARHK